MLLAAAGILMITIGVRQSSARMAQQAPA